MIVHGWLLTIHSICNQDWWIVHGWVWNFTFDGISQLSRAKQDPRWPALPFHQKTCCNLGMTSPFDGWQVGCLVGNLVARVLAWLLDAHPSSEVISFCMGIYKKQGIIVSTREGQLRATRGEKIGVDDSIMTHWHNFWIGGEAFGGELRQIERRMSSNNAWNVTKRCCSIHPPLYYFAM